MRLPLPIRAGFPAIQFFPVLPFSTFHFQKREESNVREINKQKEWGPLREGQMKKGRKISEM
jgi:hypothetical protein